MVFMMKYLIDRVLCHVLSIYVHIRNKYPHDSNLHLKKNER